MDGNKQSKLNSLCYDFVWELLDGVIYKTFYGNPLDFSKICDIVMNDEEKLTYLLFSMYLSVLCGLEPS